VPATRPGSAGSTARSNARSNCTTPERPAGALKTRTTSPAGRGTRTRTRTREAACPDSPPAQGYSPHRPPDVAQVRWLDEEEQRTWREFVWGTRLLFEALDRQMQRDSGMPHTYYLILAMLSEAPQRTL